ncbi:poly-beta-1,6-N-acetyl-D-glucosamine N-deacetylase [Citrobacter sp. NCU1]|uniref:poly-beta-1,6-N-acetyl-D-glucosamine N-deacetylase PgaB n=1 Tax=Citrobacter sp. NCU1 TaxID=2026683 RepID=UPI001390D521|nr:poly-beta-1,6-N-acetyl-D-glucosamine N-deacetylase PgaB [Citrobacter sp. NCU1]NDO81203.1 poly-beta-1,6-N-acetyl-D-glucosamine N-deacetylase [Citrobacter sp. NCU1]
MLRKGFKYLFMLISIIMLSACLHQPKHKFTPPQNRETLQAERPWPHNHFVAISWHNVEDEAADQRFMSVRTSALREQFAWLRENGYQPVSVAQIREAHRGGTPLPKKAVLLSFDDGFRSFYTRVFPLLQAFQWPALWAPVGSWVDTPLDQKVLFGDEKVDRDYFATWQQVRELSRSPLVEIASHTWNSHYGIQANSAGSLLPAFVNRAYLTHSGRYETEAEYRKRIRQDAVKMTEQLRKHTGKTPQVFVWPYGEASGISIEELKKLGYDMFFTLEPGLGSTKQLDSIPRVLIANNPSLKEFAQSIISVQEKSPERVMHIDLDYVFDNDRQQMERNLDRLIQRVKDMQISTVYLQAFADPAGDGLVKEVWFPNRLLPMKADLFNRVAWQLRNRADVRVYAWMPVLSWDLDPTLARVEYTSAGNQTAQIHPTQYRRLSPFDAKVREQVGLLYEDLAGHASFDGILFHDDALMSDFEDASAPAIAAYQKAGFAGSLDAIRQNPEQFKRWTRFKSQALTNFTLELSAKVKAIRGPQIKTARNIFALPVIQPESEAWFAQNYADFLQSYDWTAIMAMPYMEGIDEKFADKWLTQLVDHIKAIPQAKDKSILELQAQNWKSNGQHEAIRSRQLAHWMSLLQLNGIKNYGYYPDDFLRNVPAIDVIRPEFSTAWYPKND